MVNDGDGRVHASSNCLRLRYPSLASDLEYLTSDENYVACCPGEIEEERTNLIYVIYLEDGWRDNKLQILPIINLVNNK